jgi:hypothetical protein
VPTSLSIIAEAGKDGQPISDRYPNHLLTAAEIASPRIREVRDMGFAMRKQEMGMGVIGCGVAYGKAVRGGDVMATDDGEPETGFCPPRTKLGWGIQGFRIRHAYCACLCTATVTSMVLCRLSALRHYNEKALLTARPNSRSISMCVGALKLPLNRRTSGRDDVEADELVGWR